MLSIAGTATGDTISVPLSTVSQESLWKASAESVVPTLGPALKQAQLAPEHVAVSNWQQDFEEDDQLPKVHLSSPLMGGDGQQVW